MSSFGLIARADQGGLGTQTWEMARHLRPEKILVVDLGSRGRGHARLERYEGLGAEVRVCSPAPKPKHLDWLCSGVRSVYTAEGTYSDALPYYAAVNKVRLVVHANPELWSERYRDATTKIVTPTEWEEQRIPGSMVMPMPVDRERLPFRHRTEARTFWHPAAPAMNDRNGSDIVLAALPLIPEHARIVITSPDGGRPREFCKGKVTVEFRTAERENYWEGYDEADVLVLPRRYGGLSLPVQEALSSGMPVIMLETGPYIGKGGVVPVPVSSSVDVPMKGGIFAVWDAKPQALADTIGFLARDPEVVSGLSACAHTTAELISWDHWEGPWRNLLESRLGEQFPV